MPTAQIDHHNLCFLQAKVMLYPTTQNTISLIYNVRIHLEELDGKCSALEKRDGKIRKRDSYEMNVISTVQFDMPQNSLITPNYFKQLQFFLQICMLHEFVNTQIFRHEINLCYSLTFFGVVKNWLTPSSCAF